jgi:hypothetical protein
VADGMEHLSPCFLALFSWFLSGVFDSAFPLTGCSLASGCIFWSVNSAGFA